MSETSVDLPGLLTAAKALVSLELGTTPSVVDKGDDIRFAVLGRAQHYRFDAVRGSHCRQRIAFAPIRIVRDNMHAQRTGG